MRCVANPRGARLVIVDGARWKGRTEAMVSAAVEHFGELPPDGILEIHSAPNTGVFVELAPFHDVNGDGPGAIIRLSRSPLPELHEWSDLEPPEPAEHVLRRSAALGPGEVLLARVPRHPQMLLPHLAARGLEHEVALRPDGTALIWIRAGR